MPRQHFSEQLDDLQQGMLRMGSLVEQAVHKSVDALAKQDLRLAEEVLSADNTIDQLESHLEEECMRLFALQQPLARDLRVIGTVLKTITDLERMGDEATNIAKIAVRLAEEPLIKPLIDIPRMAGMVETLVHQALDAFVRRDAELARSVRLADNAVDDLYACLSDELLGITMKVDSLREASQAFNLLFTARHLERIADHATNIAERVIYMVTGHMVSHQPPDAPLPEPAAQ